MEDSLANQKHKGWALCGIALGIAIMSMNFSLVNTALASIQRDLSASLVELQWIVNIFGITISSFLLIVGRLADIYGRRLLYILGVAGFGIGSLIAGLAPSSHWIILAQGLLGVSAAIILPLSQTLLCHVFSDRERGKAIGIWASILGIMLGVGPLIGGAIIDIWSWRGVFFINVPLAIISVGLLLGFIEEWKQRGIHPSIDYLGTLLFAISIATLTLAIMQSAAWGWANWKTLTLVMVFSSALISFIVHEKKVHHPIIDFSIFCRRQFLLASSGMFCLNFIIWAMFFLIPLYLQNVVMRSPLETGFFMLLITVPVAALGSSIGKLYNKQGAKYFLLTGFVLLLVTVGMQTLFTPVSSLGFILATLLMFGCGWLLIYGPSASAALDVLPKTALGTGAGAFTTFQEIGGTLGLAITGTFFRMANAKVTLATLSDQGVVISPAQEEYVLSAIGDASTLHTHINQITSLSDNDFLSLFQQGFMEGYRVAMWSLFGIALLGFIFSLCLQQSKKN